MRRYRGGLGPHPTGARSKFNLRARRFGAIKPFCRIAPIPAGLPCSSGMIRMLAEGTGVIWRWACGRYPALFRFQTIDFGAKGGNGDHSLPEVTTPVGARPTSVKRPQ